MLYRTGREKGASSRDSGARAASGASCTSLGVCCDGHRPRALLYWMDPPHRRFSSTESVAPAGGSGTASGATCTASAPGRWLQTMRSWSR